METIAQNIHWLIPEENSPCDIFLQFRGQYALGIAAGAPVTYDFLNKLAKARYLHVYIRKEDKNSWVTWTKNRHPLEQSSPSESEPAETNALYGNKRAEYLSFMQKAVTAKEGGDVETTLRNASMFLQKIIKLPTLDWYFQQFHEPPDLFHHSARVAFPLTAFCLRNNIVSEKELEPLIFSSIIHELEGDPSSSMKSVVSEETLEQLEKQARPVPKETIALIRLQDELCSGNGFPNNKKIAEIPLGVRAFTLFNHFDHYRLQAKGTRRVRFDLTKKQMESRKIDYDPELWDRFWIFWEKQVEAVS
jgi:hypothetical protein